MIYNNLSQFDLGSARSAHELFATIKHLPFAIMLDSQGKADSQSNQYSILSAAPKTAFITRGQVTESVDQTGHRTVSNDNPFDLIAKSLSSLTVCDSVGRFPFIGGAMGYWGYELGRSVNYLPPTRHSSLVPDMQVGIYLWAIVVDRTTQQASLVAHPDCDDGDVERLMTLLDAPVQKTKKIPFRLIGSFASNLSQQDYTRAFDRVIDYINAGHCYQVNLAQCFSADFVGSPWDAYQKMAAAADAPFSAYIQGEGYQVHSLSPERFLSVANRLIETRPIKGTRPRGKDSVTDAAYKQELESSLKDRAENLMIVDLLRNDLGKCAQTGSVKVDELFAIERYSNLFHMVSTISAQLKADCQPIELLKSCFPGGSITGAPKRRAMEIIEELETTARGPYCGSIGYIDTSGRMDTNIAIRTLVSTQQKLYCWGGGGLVADSTAEEEYAESIVKVKNLLDSLNQDAV